MNSQSLEQAQALHRTQSTENKLSAIFVHFFHIAFLMEDLFCLAQLLLINYELQFCVFNAFIFDFFYECFSFLKFCLHCFVYFVFSKELEKEKG